MLDAGWWMRARKTQDSRRKTEDRGQKSELRRQKAFRFSIFDCRFATDSVQPFGSAQFVQKIHTVKIGLVEPIGGRNLKDSGFAYGKNRFFPNRDSELPSL
jgi:hypothetical protein